MDTSNLLQLEGSVSKMLEMYQALQQENRQLRQDRESLIEKNKLASAKIEAMISKLKELG
ncbi:cell division protein ZapB [Aliikangiella coralliicola]|uniref:Cell division protein ZapB n=1 Tax=Aliikangiella coralliicola TaxID=2592383 RepID=A0A545UI95_9GAMM|nr:cell division protein ZapB [Aliikangiella coralliicola]TQV89187.1 cell division protein ZapB [Aliikangiella coralliicola]